MAPHKNNFISHSTIARFFILVILSLFISSRLCIADPVRLTYVGQLPDKDTTKEKQDINVKIGTEAEIQAARDEEDDDSITNFNIFKLFEWQVQITGSNGAVRTITTTRPDSITYDNFSKVEFTTNFTVAPHLLHTWYGLQYELSGSVWVKLNNVEILATGAYNRSDVSKYCGLRQNDYTGFTFKDTMATLEVTYLPHPKIQSFFLSIKMGQGTWASDEMADAISDNKENFGLGFYYLSFGLVFLILFLFFRERTENLYFGLFCLFASLSWIGSVFENYEIELATAYMGAFALEFLSIFFARILKNKNKSKIPLAIMAVVAIGSFHPSILYNYDFFGIKVHGSFRNQSVPIVLAITFGIFYAYAGGVSLVYLVRGFRQKSWEAKTVVYMCSTAMFVSYILPGVVGSIPVIRSIPYYSEFRSLLGDIGLCIYPLSAAIVLGRRNSLNQKQLASHIKSIEQLSNENLQKEKEKKQILENQNTELEHKVEERTHEVILQKQLIEQKNKAITDNLTYAQRIQSSLLPDIKLITNTFKDSFILYLPKDIVSGDFYSFAQKGDHAVIVAGDCTGHGVSGAFMSMIGSSLLNQIINEKGLDDPALILNNLNTSVIDALKQTHNDSNDGMDICLCSINLSSKELKFAGANRPLWWIRNGHLEVIKPNKFPIGGLQVTSDRVFDNRTITLQKNDTIYLFTDGYADQFGGERGKKMMTSKFKETLLAVQELGMPEQLEHLRDHFNTWKGNEEQVDDVLVIGIRI